MVVAFNTPTRILLEFLKNIQNCFKNPRKLLFWHLFLGFLEQTVLSIF